MFLSSLIEELSTKEENNKAGCTLTFGGSVKTKTSFIKLVQINAVYFIRKKELFSASNF